MYRPDQQVQTARPPRKVLGFAPTNGLPPPPSPGSLTRNGHPVFKPLKSRLKFHGTRPEDEDDDNGYTVGHVRTGETFIDPLTGDVFNMYTKAITPGTHNRFEQEHRSAEPLSYHWAQPRQVLANPHLMKGLGTSGDRGDRPEFFDASDKFAEGSAGFITEHHKIKAEQFSGVEASRSGAATFEKRLVKRDATTDMHYDKDIMKATMYVPKEVQRSVPSSSLGVQHPHGGQRPSFAKPANRSRNKAKQGHNVHAPEAGADGFGGLGTTSRISRPSRLVAPDRREITSKNAASAYSVLPEGTLQAAPEVKRQLHVDRPLPKHTAVQLQGSGTEGTTAATHAKRPLHTDVKRQIRRSATSLPSHGIDAEPIVHRPGMQLQRDVRSQVFASASMLPAPRAITEPRIRTPAAPMQRRVHRQVEGSASRLPTYGAEGTQPLVFRASVPHVRDVRRQVAASASSALPYYGTETEPVLFKAAAPQQRDIRRQVHTSATYLPTYGSDTQPKLHTHGVPLQRDVRRHTNTSVGIVPVEGAESEPLALQVARPLQRDVRRHTNASVGIVPVEGAVSEPLALQAARPLQRDVRRQQRSNIGDVRHMPHGLEQHRPVPAPAAPIRKSLNAIDSRPMSFGSTGIQAVAIGPGMKVARDMVTMEQKMSATLGGPTAPVTAAIPTDVTDRGDVRPLREMNAAPTLHAHNHLRQAQPDSVLGTQYSLSYGYASDDDDAHSVRSGYLSV